MEEKVLSIIEILKAKYPSLPARCTMKRIMS